MIRCIDGVLTAAELESIVGQLEASEFIDGKETAGWHAKQVKNNRQLRGDSEAAKQVKKTILEALRRNTTFQMAARPKAIRSPTIGRYETTMNYGTHLDNAIMGDMRSDVSFTIFLCDPEQYEGGELVIQEAHGEQAYKLAAGSMILYPSSTLHRVNSVTSGMRLAAVSWVQSLVRDPAEREILFDLDLARRQIFQQHGKTTTFDLVSKSQANLLRKWSEP